MDYTAQTNALRAAADKLLSEGTVDCVIGLTPNEAVGFPTPIVIRNRRTPASLYGTKTATSVPCICCVRQAAAPLP